MSKPCQAIVSEDAWTHEPTKCGKPSTGKLLGRSYCQEHFEEFDDEPHDLTPWVDPEPMHTWFGLTYSSYLVLHRVAIQTMPREWQEKLVALLDEMKATIDTDQLPSEFHVRVRNAQGRLVADDWSNYERGRRRAPLRKKP